MNNRMEVTIRQLNREGISPTLWHRLKEAYRHGTDVEMEGHRWTVTGIQRSLRNQGSSATATVRRSDIN